MSVRDNAADQPVAHALQAYARHWTPVRLPEITPPRINWTPAAITCLELDKHCALCPIHKAYGLTVDLSRSEPSHRPASACRMPFAVQTLLDRKNRALT